MEQHHEDDDSDVDSHLSGGIGISYSSGIISIDSKVLMNLILQQILWK
jgi:hypothetical protein